MQNRFTPLVSASLAFAITTSMSVVARGEVLSFSEGNTVYQVSRSKDALTYRDSHLERKISLRPCSQKIAGELWGDIEKNLKGIQLVKAPAKARLPSVTFEGVQYSMAPFEKSLKYFRELPKEVMIASMRGEKACARK